MYNTTGKSSNELWAIVNSKDEIMWSFGGSSTTPKLLVYDSQGKANVQIKHIKKILGDNFRVKLIYTA